MTHEELFEAGRYAEAAESLAALIDALPPDRHITRCVYRLDLATYHEFAGNVAEAQAIRRQVIADPNCQRWIRAEAELVLRAAVTRCPQP